MSTMYYMTPYTYGYFQSKQQDQYLVYLSTASEKLNHTIIKLHKFYYFISKQLG
jgi:uncharacterized beta-barrel protein YwiB (DUF1934 family)